MQCLKINVSDGSLISIKPIPTDVFLLRNCWQVVGVKFHRPHFFLDRGLTLLDLKIDTHTKKF